MPDVKPDCADAKFRELLDLAERHAAILSTMKISDERSLKKVISELRALSRLVDLAVRGLSDPSSTTKMIYLEEINNVCAELIKTGFSNEFLRAAAIKIWARTDMAPNAVN